MLLLFPLHHFAVLLLIVSSRASVGPDFDRRHHLTFALIFLLLDFVKPPELLIAPLIVGSRVKLKQSKVCRIVVAIEGDGVVKAQSGLGILVRHHVDLPEFCEHMR